jgi:hypothetical protein
MNNTFTITLTESQVEDLAGYAEAYHETPAELLGEILQRHLFNTPVQSEINNGAISDALSEACTLAAAGHVPTAQVLNKWKGMIGL